MARILEMKETLAYTDSSYKQFCEDPAPFKRHYPVGLNAFSHSKLHFAIPVPQTFSSNAPRQGHLGVAHLCNLVPNYIIM